MLRNIRCMAIVFCALALAGSAILSCSSKTDLQKYKGSGEESFTITLRSGWVDFWVDMHNVPSEYLQVSIVDENGRECFEHSVDDPDDLLLYYAERAERKHRGWWVFGRSDWWWKFGPEPVGKRGTDGACAEGQALVEVRTSSDASKWTFEVRPTSTARAR